MNTIITLKCFNRPIYLYQVLRALANCDDISKYPVHISCDAGSTGPNVLGNMQIAEALNLSELNKKTQVQLVFQEKQLGCAGHTKYCLDDAFAKGADYVIHLEDDTVPSRPLLKYFEHIKKKLLIEPNLYFAGCTFHRPCHDPQTIIKHFPEFYSKSQMGLLGKLWFDGTGGFSMTKKTWEEIEDKGGLFAVNYVSERGRKADCTGEQWLKEIRKTDIGGFVYPMQHYFRGDRLCIFPVMSLVHNIGRMGTHADPQIYEQIHNNTLWFGTESSHVFFADQIDLDYTKLVEYGIAREID